jgi:hypothetical protein
VEKGCPRADGLSRDRVVMHFQEFDFDQEGCGTTWVVTIRVFICPGAGSASSAEVLHYSGRILNILCCPGLVAAAP